MNKQTPLSPSASAIPNYLNDPQLSAMLSRLAALQGHAVAAYRFGMVENTTDGLPIASLPRHLQAVELWRTQFPAGVQEVLSIDSVERGAFPLLWISEDGQRVELLRGKLSGGLFSTENASGVVTQLQGESLIHGFALRLQPAEALDGVKSEVPKTASDWFVHAIRKYRSVFMDSVLATLLLSLVGLAGAMYAMQVYDRVLPTKGYSTLIVLTVGALLAIGLELILKQVRSHMVDRACKEIDQELSAVFFGKALAIRMDARPRTVGTFASQIRHFESVRSFLTASTLFVLADAPFALLFIAIIATISIPVALVPLFVVPIAFLVGYVLHKPIEAITAMNMAESNRKNGLLIESIDGIESIKAANAEWKLIDRWRHLTQVISASELKAKALTSLSTNLTYTLQQLTYVFMVLVGAYAITQGELTMGGLIACTIISGRAMGPFAQIPSLAVQWKQAQIALRTLDDIMALPNDRDDGQRLVIPDACKGEVTFQQASFAYGMGQPTLQVPNIRIAPGERVGVIGAVGSGKSTFLKLMSGLYRCQQGTVSLDGLDMMQMAPEFVREHIGYLPQDVRVYQGTLRENLVLGLPSPSDAQILAAASMTGLDQVISAHPKGLDLEISEGGQGLSGGQRQLVGLTRMLLQQPRILLLDEPTASMDAQLESRVIHHLFRQIAPDSVLVVVTHKPALLAQIQRLIVIDRGRVVLDGPRDQVLARLRALTTAAPTGDADTAVASSSQAQQ